MLQFLFFAIDSFVAMAALGTLGLDVSRRRSLCVAFGLWDGLAALAGQHIHLQLIAEERNNPWSSVAIICLWIAAAALVAYRIQVRGAVRLWQLTLLPLLLSLDNLFAGSMSPWITAHAVSAPALLGMLSGVLAFAGYQAGTQIGSQFHPRIAFGLGAAALALLPILS
jgi:putative Mn2+ efflux pump MntP